MSRQLREAIGAQRKARNLEAEMEGDIAAGRLKTVIDNFAVPPIGT